eukprot:4327182-Amphidinium_carterae.1
MKFLGASQSAVNECSSPPSTRTWSSLRYRAAASAEVSRTEADRVAARDASWMKISLLSCRSATQTRRLPP